MTFKEWQADFAAGSTKHRWSEVAKTLTLAEFVKARTIDDAHLPEHVSIMTVAATNKAVIEASTGGGRWEAFQSSGKD